ncbi:MAG: hypothetical protein ABI883_00695 [Chthoniobacterales bacterium]
MKAFIFFLTVINLNVSAAEPSPQGWEKAVQDAEKAAGDWKEAGASGMRYRSPDGRYGLRVTDEPESLAPGALRGNDRVELIELATKRALVLLSDHDPEAGPEQSGDARLDWSADSQRVAAYTGGKHEGQTRIFVRDGDGFVEVKLPELPELPEKPSPAFAKKHKFKSLKTGVNDKLVFVRWSETGDLELKLYNFFPAVGPGPGLGWEINLTVAIDSKHQAKLKNVVKKEVAHE